MTQQNVITIRHQDTVDSVGNDSFLQAEKTLLPPSYNEVVDVEPVIQQEASHELETLPTSSSFEFDYSPYTIGDSFKAESLLYETDDASISMDETNTDLDTPTYNFDTSLTNGVGDGDDLSLDATVHVTSTDREIEDEV